MDGMKYSADVERPGMRQLPDLTRRYRPQVYLQTDRPICEDVTRPRISPIDVFDRRIRTEWRPEVSCSTFQPSNPYFPWMDWTLNEVAEKSVFKFMALFHSNSSNGSFWRVEVHRRWAHYPYSRMRTLSSRFVGKIPVAHIRELEKHCDFQLCSFSDSCVPTWPLIIRSHTQSTRYQEVNLPT